MALTIVISRLFQGIIPASGVREVAQSTGLLLDSMSLLMLFPLPLCLKCLSSPPLCSFPLWSNALGLLRLLLDDRRDLVCIVYCHLPKKLTAFSRHWLNND